MVLRAAFDVSKSSPRGVTSLAGYVADAHMATLPDGGSMLLTADQHARIEARSRAKAAELKLTPLERLRLLEALRGSRH